MTSSQFYNVGKCNGSKLRLQLLVIVFKEDCFEFLMTVQDFSIRNLLRRNFFSNLANQGESTLYFTSMINEFETTML